MARFKNSNRQATEQMAYTAGRVAGARKAQTSEQPYFKRIGFDFAMI